MTSQSYSVVDDHVKRLLKDGRLRRVASGVFEAVEDLPPAQAISLTVLPSGWPSSGSRASASTSTRPDQCRIGSLFRGSAEGVAELRRHQVAAAAREKERDDAIRVLQGAPLQTEIEFT